MWELWKMALGSFSDEKTKDHDNKIALIRTVIVLINVMCAFFYNGKYYKKLVA